MKVENAVYPTPEKFMALASAVVEYPSRAEFQKLVTSPEVQAIGIHREAGLAGQLLILTTGM